MTASSRHTLVIARYKEDPRTWLSPEIRALFGRIIMYDKGSSQPPRNCSARDWQNWLKTLTEVVSLPNVGHESHTYLHHIREEFYRSDSNERNDKGACTFFCQGDPIDHIQYFAKTENKPESMDPLTYFKESLASAMEHGFSEYATTTGHYCPLKGWRLSFWAGSYLTPNRCNEPLEVWFERVVGRSMPEQHEFKWVIGAAIAVRNDRMFARGEAGIQDLYIEAEAGGAVHPEVGHFFERAWRYLFTPSVHQCSK